MKKYITIAAIITAAVSSISSVSAEGYNRSGNYVTKNGTVVITNPKSSYDLGDVVIKKNTNSEVRAGNYTYKQAGNEVVKVRTKDNWTVGTIDFDRNGNVDLNSSMVQPTDDGCGVTHRCGGSTGPTNIDPTGSISTRP